MDSEFDIDFTKTDYDGTSTLWGQHMSLDVPNEYYGGTLNAQGT